MIFKDKIKVGDLFIESNDDKSIAAIGYVLKVFEDDGELMVKCLWSHPDAGCYETEIRVMTMLNRISNGWAWIQKGKKKK